MTTVWIVNNAGHDFSLAKQYGELRDITRGNLDIFRPDRNLFNITETLLEFDSKVDYLLLSGNVLANMMVASVLFLVHKVKSINLLIYDAKNCVYLNHNLVLDKSTKQLKFVRKRTDELAA